MADDAHSTPAPYVQIIPTDPAHGVPLSLWRHSTATLMEGQASAPSTALVQQDADCRRWCFVSVPEQHTPAPWRRLAQEFREAAVAWRTELKGRRYCQGAIDFASWKRLREGKPQHFERFDAARSRLLLEPTNQLGAIRAKLELFADLFGLGDLHNVSLDAASQDPPTRYLGAIAADLRRASNAAKKVVTPGWRVIRRGASRR